MDYHIDKHGRLVLTADDADHRRWNGYDDGNELLRDIEDALSTMLCANGPFQWADASMFGDLTDAPMLAIFEDDKPIARWAYMGYQINDWREELVDSSEVIWDGGAIEGDDDPATLAKLAGCEVK
jgi:hypothetical protein